MCLNAAMSSQRLIEHRNEIFANARVALSLIASDLRCVCVLSNDFPLVGMDRELGDAEADNLDFATHNYRPKKARESDFCAVSYYLNKDSKSGALSLWCRINPHVSSDAISGGKRQEIIPNVRGLRFEYFDGLEWQDNWGESGMTGSKASSTTHYQTGLPDAVRITLWLETGKDENNKSERTQKEPAQKVQTVVRINMAPLSQQINLSKASRSDSNLNAPDMRQPSEK